MNSQSDHNIVTSEIVESFIVDNSFIAKRFTLADGAYSIIKLSSSKQLIIKFKDNSNDSPYHYLKKILKADGDLFFFPERSDVVNPTAEQQKIYALRSKVFLKGLTATFEFKKGSIKNLLVNILSVGKPYAFYELDFATFRKTLALKLTDQPTYSQQSTRSPSNFFFKSLSSKKKIEFIATTSIPREASWTADEYFSWKCKGSVNIFNSCEINSSEIYFPRFSDSEDHYAYRRYYERFAGTYKKYLCNFKNGEINGAELRFRINGEVNQIAHFNAGTKNGWHLYLKKNHGLDLLTNKDKTSYESIANHKSIAKSVFYKDGKAIDNPFIIVAKATQPSLF